MLTVAAPIVQTPPIAQPQMDALRNTNARFEPIPEPAQNSGSTRPRSEADDYDKSRAAVQPKDNSQTNTENLDPRAITGNGDESRSGQRQQHDSNARDQDPSPEQQRQERVEISELAARDREVRAHEAAHAAVGGQYAGAPSYSFKRGPDGRSYAVAGEVAIDASPIPGDAAATIRKLQTVQRAALAPVDPSAQDQRVAARAAGQIAKARAELLAQARTEQSTGSSSTAQTQKAQSATATSSASEKARAVEKESALPGATVTLGSDQLYVNCALCSRPHLPAPTTQHFTINVPEALSALDFSRKLKSTGAVFANENPLKRSA